MITYRLANDGDNQQLIALTSSSGMEGEIALRIDREPDFFSLLRQRGKTRVFVAEENKTIIGSICVSLQEIYVDSRLIPLWYIGDFKVANTSRNRGVGLQLCNEMANYVIGEGADLAFLNIAKGNTKPLSFFKNRPSVPDFENLGVFIIRQFIGTKRKFVYPSVNIEQAAVSEELVQFLNCHYSKYQLGPVITKSKLEGAEIFIIRQQHDIVAVMCLADTMASKQNVVTSLSWRLKWMLKTINAVRGITRMAKMPELNEPVRLLYIKYLAVNGTGNVYAKAMVNYARNIVYNRSYSFAAIGLHEKDPLNRCFAGIPVLTFKSVGMLVSIRNNQALVEKVKQGIPFEDYSLV